MVDVVDRQTRSRMMAGIKGRNTKPEVELRQALHALGFRFRLHDRRLPGRPDIVLPKWKVAVQVHGCFWHRHDGCRFATTPATRPAFWLEKFDQNVERDRRDIARLQEAGWRTAVVWECALRKGGNTSVIATLADWIMNGDGSIELPSPDLDMPRTS